MHPIKERSTIIKYHETTDLKSLALKFARCINCYLPLVSLRHRSNARQSHENNNLIYGSVTTTTTSGDKNAGEIHLKTVGRPRQVLTREASTNNSSCSSGISSAGVSELQWPTDFDNVQQQHLSVNETSFHDTEL